MKLFINGKETDNTACDLLELLQQLNIHPQSVVVEHNGKILSRQANVSFAEGDVLEIIKFVGGGS